MTKNRTALISGASIAGLTTAYWLQKAGFEVTIVEKSDGLRMGGYGVDIRGTAVEVIKRMGILDEVRQADTAMEGVFLVTKSGALIQTNDAAPGSQHDDIEIMRDDLTSILYSHVQKNVTFLWNARDVQFRGATYV